MGKRMVDFAINIDNDRYHEKILYKAGFGLDIWDPMSSGF